MEFSENYTNKFLNKVINQFYWMFYIWNEALFGPNNKNLLKKEISFLKFDFLNIIKKKVINDEGIMGSSVPWY